MITEMAVPYLTPDLTVFIVKYLSVALIIFWFLLKICLLCIGFL